MSGKNLLHQVHRDRLDTISEKIRKAVKRNQEAFSSSSNPASSLRRRCRILARDL
jgi:hypothetical protein